MGEGTIIGTVSSVPVNLTSDLASSAHDAVVLVTLPFDRIPRPPQLLEDFIRYNLDLDKHLLQKEAACLICPTVCGNRLIISPTGPISKYDDVRSIGDAAKKGIRRAIQAGSKKPILVVQTYPDFSEGELVLVLGALEALYVPLQLREIHPERSRKLLGLGVYCEGTRTQPRTLLTKALALEESRCVTRDIAGGDSERMTPARVVEYVRARLDAAVVRARVLDDPAVFRAQYPLFAAVDRAGTIVDRYKGRIMFLEYTPSHYAETLMLVGKGVTYDTGGADIKIAGTMVGMSRDKSGAAVVAGIFKLCELLRPNTKVMGVMGLVRNNVGEEAYVADELLLSRSGLTVRIANTDTEGRLVMGDLLYEFKERARLEKNPHLYTIATLTGHALKSYGCYSAVMDNHAARAVNHASKFRAYGDSLGDMVEVSTVRREDFAAHKGRMEGDDLYQAQNLPTSLVTRGHQGPTAFLIMVARLDNEDIKYSALDIAGSGAWPPDEPSAAPLLAIAKTHELI